MIFSINIIILLMFLVSILSNSIYLRVIFGSILAFYVVGNAIWSTLHNSRRPTKATMLSDISAALGFSLLFLAFVSLVLSVLHLLTFNYVVATFIGAIMVLEAIRYLRSRESRSSRTFQTGVLVDNSSSNTSLAPIRRLLQRFMKPRWLMDHLYVSLLASLSISFFILIYSQIHTTMGLLPNTDLYDHILIVKTILKYNGWSSPFGPGQYTLAFDMVQGLLSILWGVGVTDSFIFAQYLYTALFTTGSFLLSYHFTRSPLRSFVSTIFILGIFGWAWGHYYLFPLPSTFAVISAIFFLLLVMNPSMNHMRHTVWIYTMFLAFFAFVYRYILPYVLGVSILFIGYRRARDLQRHFFVTIAFVMGGVGYLIAMLLGIIMSQPPYWNTFKINFILETYSSVFLLLVVVGAVYIILSRRQTPIFLAFLAFLLVFSLYSLPISTLWRIEEFGRYFTGVIATESFHLLDRDAKIGARVRAFKKYKFYGKLQRKTIISFFIIVLIFNSVFPYNKWIQGYKGFGNYASFNNISANEYEAIRFISNHVSKDVVILSDAYMSQLISALTDLETSRLSIDRNPPKYDVYLSLLTFSLLRDMVPAEIDDRKYVLIVSKRTETWTRIGESGLSSWTEIDEIAPSTDKSPEYPLGVVLFENDEVTVYGLGRFLSYSLEESLNKDAWRDKHSNLVNIDLVEVGGDMTLVGYTDSATGGEWYGLQLRSESGWDMSGKKAIQFTFGYNSSHILTQIRIHIKEGGRHKFWDLPVRRLQIGEWTRIIILPVLDEPHGSSQEPPDLSNVDAIDIELRIESTLKESPLEFKVKRLVISQWTEATSVLRSEILSEG